jgi:hypothetical protein
MGFWILGFIVGASLIGLCALKSKSKSAKRYNNVCEHLAATNRYAAHLECKLAQQQHNSHRTTRELLIGGRAPRVINAKGGDR